MVRAKYMIEGDTHTLTVLGHAEYDEYGKDIVCAGVSALVQALIGWIENNPHTAECVSIDDSGEVIVSARGGDDVAAVFYMTAIGVAQIAECYRDHVSIDIAGLTG